MSSPSERPPRSRDSDPSPAASMAKTTTRGRKGWWVPRFSIGQLFRLVTACACAALLTNTAGALRHGLWGAWVGVGAYCMMIAGAQLRGGEKSYGRAVGPLITASLSMCVAVVGLVLTRRFAPFGVEMQGHVAAALVGFTAFTFWAVICMYIFEAVDTLAGVGRAALGERRSRSRPEKDQAPNATEGAPGPSRVTEISREA